MNMCSDNVVLLFVSEDQESFWYTHYFVELVNEVEVYPVPMY
jgi:hypothetical protein